MQFLSMQSLRFFFFTLICILLLLEKADAQECPPVGTRTCDAAKVQYLDYLCTSTSPATPANPSYPFPGCPSLWIDNASWFAFEAQSNFIEFLITVGECKYNGGLHGAIYSNCEPNKEPIYAPSCDCKDSGKSFKLAGPVTKGTIYYLMIDGCGGDVCDFSIELTRGEISGPTETLNGQVLTSLTGPDSVCTYDDVIFETNAISEADFYEWTIPGAQSVFINGYRKVKVQWKEGSGTYEVAVKARSACGDESNTLTKTVVVTAVPKIDLGEFNYCTNTSEGFYIPELNKKYRPGKYVDLQKSDAPSCNPVYSFVIKGHSLGTARLEFEWCKGETYSIIDPNTKEKVCTYNQPGDYVCTIKNGTFEGCDSMISVTILESPPVVIRDTIQVAQIPAEGPLDTVFIKPVFGCDTLKITRYEVISANHQLGSVNLEVYPNPANSTIWLKMSGTTKPLKFQLVHPQGGVVYTFTAQGLHAIEVEAYPRGYYWLQCIDPSGEQLTIPLVLQ